MKSSLLLLAVLLASCALAAPVDDLESSGLGPEKVEDDVAAAVEDDNDSSNMATGDAAFATNFGSDNSGAVSTSFSATASVSIY